MVSAEGGSPSAAFHRRPGLDRRVVSNPYFEVVDTNYPWHRLSILILRICKLLFPNVIAGSWHELDRERPTW
jgi:hypothetical protein